MEKKGVSYLLDIEDYYKKYDPEELKETGDFKNTNITKNEVSDDKPVGKGTKTTIRKVKKTSDEGTFGKPFDTSLSPALRQSLRAGRQTKKPPGPSTVKAPDPKPKIQPKPYVKPVPKPTVKDATDLKTDKKPVVKTIQNKAGSIAQNRLTTQAKIGKKPEVKTSKVDVKTTKTTDQTASNTKSTVKSGSLYNYTLSQPKKVITKKAVVKRSPIQEKVKSSNEDVHSVATTEVLDDYESDFEEASESEKSVSEASNKKIVQKGSPKYSKKTENKEHSSYQEYITESKTKSSSRTSTPRLVRDASKNVQVHLPENVQGAEKGDADINDEIIDYDDDFEDYESDFEDDTESGFTGSDEDQISSVETASDTDSELKKIKPIRMHVLVEEEKKMDSGNYDLAMKMIKSDVLRSSQLKEIKEAISRENTIYNESPTDLSIFASGSNLPLNFQLDLNKLNFVTAVKTKKHFTAKDRMLDRARTLLDMVQMYPMNFNLFHIAPIPYNEYIKLFGRSNTVQVLVQTNDDDVTVEIQTEKISFENKWTQHPVEYHKWENEAHDLPLYLHDRKGVGGDDVFSSMISKGSLLRKYNYNQQHLNDFIISAGRVMLVLLEEEAMRKTQSSSKEKPDLGFSDDFITMNVDGITFLKGRQITNLVFSPHNPQIVLSCHQSSSEFGKTFIDQCYGRSIVCVWDVLQPSQPLKLLVASDEITSLCFDASYDCLIYAGLNDGSLCAWDLSERTEWHQQSIAVDMPFVLRSPTYCTFYSHQDKEFNKHYSPVTSVKSVGYNKSGDYLTSDPPTGLISLSRNAKCIMWSVYRIPRKSHTELNLVSYPGEDRTAPWGNISIKYNSTVNVKKNFSKGENTDFLEINCISVLLKEERSRLLLGTNIGYVISSTGISWIPSIRLYGQYDASLNVTCIDPCPQLGDFFLVGYNDGNVDLYDVEQSKSLTTFSSYQGIIGNPITYLRWSSFKIGLFFVMDNESCVYMWDILEGDMLPKFSVSMRKKLATNMDVSCSSKNPYLGVTIKKTQLRIHKLRPELLSKDGSGELKLFKHYISKL